MYLLLGYGASNKSIAKYLSSKKIEYHVYDDYLNKIDIDFSKYDMIVKSPGYPENDIILNLKRLNKKIISDLELFNIMKKETRRITVTGTNGKSTTVSLIKNILKKRVNVCGNIGIPLFDNVTSKKDSLIEASSFMLSYVYTYESKYNVILNLKSNHLEYHKTFNNYVASKMKLIKNIKWNDFLIYNQDDILLNKLLENVICYKIPFSLHNTSKGGYIKNDYLYFNHKKIIKISDVPLIGMHNLENVLASICVSYCYGATIDEIKEGILSYQNIEHRLEKYGKIGSTDIYNDSKATNIYALNKAIDAVSSIDKYQKIALICGGKKKEDDINISNNLSKIKKVYICGENHELLEDYFSENKISHEVFTSLLNCLNKVKEEISLFDVLLFSPGAQSYDQFKNFQERGCFFKENML